MSSTSLMPIFCRVSVNHASKSVCSLNTFSSPRRYISRVFNSFFLISGEYPATGIRASATLNMNVHWSGVIIMGSVGMFLVGIVVVGASSIWRVMCPIRFWVSRKLVQ